MEPKTDEFTCIGCKYLISTSDFSADCTKHRNLVVIWLPDSTVVIQPETEQGCILKKLEEQNNE